jgi:hypothetical protein
VPDDLEMITGMQIKYYLKDIEYGKGIFSSESIPQGTLIWKFSSGINVRVVS